MSLFVMELCPDADYETQQYIGVNPSCRLRRDPEQFWSVITRVGTVTLSSNPVSELWAEIASREYAYFPA